MLEDLFPRYPSNLRKSISIFFIYLIPGEFRVYKIRWLILGLFVLYSASNALQWIQYSIIANIVQKYVYTLHMNNTEAM